MAKQHADRRPGATGNETGAASPAAMRERQRALAASPWPIAVAPAGPAAVGAAAWRWRGLLRVTVVVKATFEIVPDGIMKPVRPVDIRRAEVHFHNNPARSVSATSDLGLYLERADVVLTGHAFAPPGAVVNMITVRLRVLRGDGAPALDKSADVYGERSAWRGEPSPEAQPFQQMPLVYERAYGGMGWGPNPFGMGIEANPAGRIALPNIVHSGPPTGRTDPAGFAPISPSLPARRALLGGLSRKILEQRIAEIPDGFDWSYFQSSPPDQRIDFLQGDEWIIIEGMHPKRAVVTTRLPGARGVARVRTPTGTELPIELRADTLVIDTDAELVSVVWRGRFAVSAQESLGLTSVVAGVQIAGGAFEWPAMPVPLAKSDIEGGFVPADDVDFDTTVKIDDAEPTATGAGIHEQSPYGQTMALEELPSGTSAQAQAGSGENPLESTMQLPNAEGSPPDPAALEALLKNFPRPGGQGPRGA